MKRTMKIGKPVLSYNGGKARVTASINLQSEGGAKSLWFEVDDEYGKYLCSERGDAYLIGLLWYAMFHQYDMELEVPVTGELLHQVQTWLIPSLVKNSKVLHEPKITCAVEDESLPNAGAVGTGMSCGVDSLHAVSRYYKHPLSRFRLTHLAIFNVGAFGLYDIDKADAQFKWQMENSRCIANELGLKLVVGNSNLKGEFFTDNRCTHTFTNMFAVFMLQKLWGTYYYSSAGWDMSRFDINDADRNDAAQYDILSLACFSTRALKLYSEGAALTRYEKMKDLLQFPYARKYLHVCCQDEGGNCGKCFKCKRTMVALDALGILDEFSDVFDVKYYRCHKSRYLLWLAAQRYGDTDEIHLIPEAFTVMHKAIPWYCHVGGILLGLKERLKRNAKNSLFFYRLYWRLKGQPQQPKV